MNEKQLEKKLVYEVKRLGGLALKFWPASFTGLPDRIVLMPVRCVVFVELKSPGKKPTARQLVVHGMLDKLGFAVEVVSNEAQLDMALRRLVFMSNLSKGA